MSHKRRWSYDRVGLGIRRFKREFGYYPVARDFDMTEYLPSAKYVQRNFGGLIELRKKLKIGLKDFSRGSYSSQRARKLKLRLPEVHNDLKRIIKRYGSRLTKFKIEEYIPLHTYRATLDFKLSNEAQNCVVEGVYAKDERTLIGCIHNKLSKYVKYDLETKCVYVVVMNTDIDQKIIERSLNKQKKIYELPINIKIIALKSFKDNLRKGLLPKD